jgi:hypothetical protein
MNFRKILKWTGIILLSLLVFIVAVTLLSPIRKNPEIDVVALRKEVKQPYHLME